MFVQDKDSKTKIGTRAVSAERNEEWKATSGRKISPQQSGIWNLFIARPCSASGASPSNRWISDRATIRQGYNAVMYSSGYRSGPGRHQTTLSAAVCRCKSLATCTGLEVLVPRHTPLPRHRHTHRFHTTDKLARSGQASHEMRYLTRLQSSWVRI